MAKNGLSLLIGIVALTTIILVLAVVPEEPKVPAADHPGASDGAPRDGSVAPPSTSPSATGAGAVTIEMASLKYQPATVTVAPGTTVTWVNEDPFGHTVTPTDKDLWGTDGSGDDPAAWLDQGDSWRFTFTEPGTYTYYCIPHASQGDDGTWRGMVATVAVTADGVPSDGPQAPAFEMPAHTVVPDPVAPPVLEPDADGVVRVTLETIETVAQLDDGAAYEFWTFGGTVPGPMIRVREGDTVELTLVNPSGSAHPHNIDLHAVTGPGGGAAATLAQPGESRTFTFLARHPGLYVYHCAAGHVPSHIANGMYGMILVEPREGLAPVDREYYVVQGEVYTDEPAGATGLLSYSLPKVLDEAPEYYLFNGRVGALTGEGALVAEVNETVRLFFGVGGAVPSSFHLIGEVFDRVYMDGETRPSENRQTVMVPAAGSAILEFDVNVPGTYVLVDHTLSRTFDRGAAGYLVVTGPEDRTIFQEGGPS